MIERIRRLSQKPRTRDRALALLLSHQGKTAPELAGFFDVHRNSIINWFNAFETHGLVGLYDGARSGRRRSLNAEHAEQVKTWVKENPQNLDHVAARVAEHYGISVSRWTIKRLLKSQGMTWRRVRRGMPKQETADVLEKKGPS
jgi:transposase